jgi:uncharacterized zinc-type alcohol dehydrogenase-like protein
MSEKIKAFAATAKGGKLEPFEFDPGPLGDDHVEIKVEYCGVCHSDLSMLNNDWGMTAYPFVPGHEVSGTVGAVGSQVKHLKVGQRVGLGWYSGSCMVCHECMSGDHNLCKTVESTIIHRHGGFANRVRCKSEWAIPLSEALPMAKAGPLFCGGITVFNPIVQFDIKATSRVGVIGIGGLGHLALQFLNKWGCEVFAFSSSESKDAEAKQLGAHHVIHSREAEQLKKIAGTLDFILVTANVPLEWSLYLAALNPKGRLHFVGAVAAPLGVLPIELLGGQKTISGSPLGSPVTTATMLDFCARHDILPVTEEFPMSRVMDGMERLRSGKARYRIVLKNDIK